MGKGCGTHIALWLMMNIKDMETMKRRKGQTGYSSLAGLNHFHPGAVSILPAPPRVTHQHPPFLSTFPNMDVWQL